MVVLMDRENLKLKRARLVDQAEYYLREDDFQSLSEILTVIAEISLKIGDENMTNFLIENFPEIRALIIGSDAPFEPEILLQTAADPPASQSDSITENRRTVSGAPLESGIIPTVVKDDHEILLEIITENLPYISDKEKEHAVERLLKLPPGAKRDAYLKVFLIKNRQYGMIDSVSISKKIDEKKAWFVKASQKDIQGTIGLFDPFQIIESMKYSTLNYLLGEANKSIDFGLRNELIVKFYEIIESNYNQSPEIQETFPNPIVYLGHVLYSDSNLYPYFENFDIISKQELVDIFTDFCADNQINVYDLSSDHRIPWDLYLSKEDTTDKGGVAILLRGFEIKEQFKEALRKLSGGSEFCSRIVLVITSLGVLEVGLDHLRHECEKVSAWVYIVDPMRGIIYEFMRGDESQKIDSEKEIFLIKSCNSPLRYLNSHKNYSEYTSDTKFQYKSKNYLLFAVNEYPYKSADFASIERDKKNLQYLIILHKEKGVSLNYIEWVPESLDPDLISGLITAIDNFGNNFGEARGLQEIQYSGFTITFADGKYTKACLFLKETPSSRLKELLEIAVNRWEAYFEEVIKDFQGSLKLFAEKNAEIQGLLNRVFLGEFTQFQIDPVIQVLPLPV